MVPFLLAKFWPILKWYHFKPPFFIPEVKRGFSLRGLNEKSPNGTFLLTNFSHFLKWYLLLATKFIPPKTPLVDMKKGKRGLNFSGFRGVSPPLNKRKQVFRWLTHQLAIYTVSWTKNYGIELGMKMQEANWVPQLLYLDMKISAGMLQIGAVCCRLVQMVTVWYRLDHCSI